MSQRAFLHMIKLNISLPLSSRFTRNAA